LLGDGRVERSVYQPADVAPEALKEILWERVVPAGKLEHADWEGPIREVPARKDQAAGEAYVAAWGKFASAEAIPAHFVHRSSDGSREGRLKATASRNDFGLATEH